MFLLTVVLLYFINYTQSAKILGVFLQPLYGQQIIYQQIYTELSLRGHQITIFTPSPINDAILKNLTEVELNFNSILEKYKHQEFLSKNLNPYRILINNFNFLDNLIDETFNKIQTHTQNQTFDLILLESSHPALFALSYKFQAPTILISGKNVLSFVYDSVGNPNHPILYPEDILNLNPVELGLLTKTQSLCFFLWSKYYYYYYIVPHAHQTAKKYFGEIPYISDLEKNVSMLFVNRNFLIHTPRANVPAVVEIFPLKKHSPTALPKDLKKILDEANKGVIFVSFGTVKTSLFSKQLQNVLIHTFEELPYKVLLKWDFDSSAFTSNVIIKKWFPQKDILAHPNVKAFVTHGGLQSIEDAISGQVPMIGIPFADDQPRNIRRIVELTIGKELNPDYLNKIKLKNAIVEVAEVGKYKNRIKEVANILYDRPITGLESAVYWSEYVIRYKGAKHLRSASVDMHWFSYLLFDVVLFLMFVGLIFCYIVLYLFKITVNLWKRKEKQQ